MDANAKHCETLILAHPVMAHAISKKLSTAIRELETNPESVKKFRETSSMTPPRVPGEQPEGESTTESGLLRAALEMASNTGRSEGRAVTKFQLGIMSTLVGVLWVITMSLGGAIWSDMKARVATSEVSVREIQLDVNTLKGRDGDKDRRLDKIEAKQDLTIQKIEELKDELRKPK